VIEADILHAVPAASVVIPTRNRREPLERAIESIRGQTLSDWELVVVDDASGDDTPSFLAGIEDPRIRVVRLEEHAERSVARNRGLELVGAPGVLFLDDDDELRPDGLKKLVEALQRSSEACASVGASVHDTDGMLRCPAFPSRPMVIDVRLDLLVGWVALCGQTLFRTAAIRRAGAWREGLSVAEDQELWLRVSACGPVAIVPDVVLLHRPHGLAGNVPGWRDVERGVVRRYLEGGSSPGPRASRAAQAREHLRDADISFQLGAYGSALRATVRGIVTAPFLLASPLVGPGLARGLANALVATALPRATTERLRGAVRRRRTRSMAPR
jgi:GT2 family glycosyltransferase